MRNRGDRPEPGKVYSLTGSRSIMAGDNWQASEVFCGGSRGDHRPQGCTEHQDHEHSGPNTIMHTRGAAMVNGCTPYACGLKGRTA